MRTELLVLALSSSACITLTNVNVGQKTSLEKQLMGEFEPLSDEELLAASVRAGPAATETRGLAVHDAALHARERQLFNRDDVNALKRDGCVGEGMRAQLKSRACGRESESTVRALREKMLREENADRTALIAWARSLDASDVAQNDDIVLAYTRFLHEAAAPGDYVEQENGAWVRR